MLHEVIKYKNRKLYSKLYNRYVTLKEIKAFVEEGHSIFATSTVTGFVITKDVLTAALKYANVSEDDLSRLIREGSNGQFSENSIIQ